MEPTVVEELVQPILSTLPEPRHKAGDMLPLAGFLTLLREEEDYFKGDQHNTKLMITRLRKIFYDKWGWNSQLIKGAWNIDGRYEVDIRTTPPENGEAASEVKKVRRYHDYQNQPKYRWVTYRKNDRVYGASRDREVPFIYKSNHQEVLLPEGYCCDIAHVLAGLDAFNHPQVVSPLPPLLSFLYRLFPHVDSNMDVVTWLGDIATSAGDFVFAYVRDQDQPLRRSDEQRYINNGAPASDMLGNIDAYVIAKTYPLSANKGRRITDILEDYYYGDGPGRQQRSRRFSIFCKAIGLQNWNGNHFSNEAKWLAYYEKQLRNNTAFQVYSLSEGGLRSIVLPFKIWRRRYDHVIKAPILLSLFLNALKELIKQEPNP
jgi:hypothetical protein